MCKRRGMISQGRPGRPPLFFYLCPNVRQPVALEFPEFPELPYTPELPRPDTPAFMFWFPEFMFIP